MVVPTATVKSEDRTRIASVSTPESFAAMLLAFSQKGGLQR